jgi:hypothetical protein
MCVFRYEYPDDDEPIDPLPRSNPRLLWTLPVNIIALASSVDAYRRTLPQVNTLRLVHRFRKGALSKIPEELLELIVRKTRNLELLSTTQYWTRLSLCFFGKCNPGHHYRLYGEHTDRLWHKLNRDSRELRSKLTEEQTACMVERQVDEMERLTEDVEEEIIDFHTYMKTDWLDATCLCVSNDLSPSFESAFYKINRVSNGSNSRCTHIDGIQDDEHNFWSPSSGVSRATSRKNQSSCGLLGSL